MTYLFLCFLTIISLMPLIGKHLFLVFNGEKTFLDPIIKPFENWVYKFCRITHKIEQNWKEYAISMLIFNLCGAILLFIILKFQVFFPLNPENLPGLSNDLAFNIAISFTANTNWQSYVPETTLSPFSQNFGLTLQNFFSSATGLSLAVALVRSLIRKQTNLIGNFYQDLTKSVLYALLPLSIISGFLNILAGVPQNFHFLAKIINQDEITQIIKEGFIASQIAIKQIGTNGGGYFVKNAAHVLENPNSYSNFIQIISMLLLPCSITYFFGLMIKDKLQGWLIFSILAVIIFATFSALYAAETHSGEFIDKIGKEERFSPAETLTWSTIATAISAGSTNSDIASYSDLGLLILMINMIFSEVVFGGVGSGLYGVLIYVIITSFIAGLMVGKKPEYLGKKIESPETKLAIISVLIIPIVTILAIAGTIGFHSEELLKLSPNIANRSPRGFAEIIYSFISTTGNNGSGMSSLNTNTPFFNYLTAATIFIGRFIFAVSVLAIAGKLAPKAPNKIHSRFLIAGGVTFSCMLTLIIIIIGGLTFLPILALGPILGFLNG